MLAITGAHKMIGQVFPSCSYDKYSIVQSLLRSDKEDKKSSPPVTSHTQPVLQVSWPITMRCVLSNWIISSSFVVTFPVILVFYIFFFHCYFTVHTISLFFLAVREVSCTTAKYRYITNRWIPVACPWSFWGFLRNNFLIAAGWSQGNLIRTSFLRNRCEEQQIADRHSYTDGSCTKSLLSGSNRYVFFKRQILLSLVCCSVGVH